MRRVGLKGREERTRRDATWSPRRVLGVTDTVKCRTEDGSHAGQSRACVAAGVRVAAAVVVVVVVGRAS